MIYEIIHKKTNRNYTVKCNNPEQLKSIISKSYGNPNDFNKYQIQQRGVSSYTIVREPIKVNE